MKRLVTFVRAIFARIFTILRRRSLGRFNSQKSALLDSLFADLNPSPSSFADLGGVWAVNGAYTFDLLDRYPIERAIIVDTDFTQIVTRKAAAYPQLQLISSNFGDAALPEQLGSVDIVMLFDVLLHQVAPDWDEILQRYAPHTRAFAIFNQQWVGSGGTVRLLDMGEEAYFRNIPHSRSDGEYESLFSHLDEIHPRHQRPWRDIHNIWQWGITDRDLIAKMDALGYRQTYYRNHGPFGFLPNIENHAFVFVKP